MVPAFPRDYTTAPARTRLPVIAAQAAIQDGALPGTRMVPPTLRALCISMGCQAARLGFLDCGLRRNDDKGGMTVGYLIPAWVSWIAAYAAMTTGVHYYGLPYPGLGFLDCGLRRNDDKRALLWAASSRPGFPGLRPSPQ